MQVWSLRLIFYCPCQGEKCFSFESFHFYILYDKSFTFHFVPSEIKERNVPVSIILTLCFIWKMFHFPVRSKKTKKVSQFPIVQIKNFQKNKMESETFNIQNFLLKRVETETFLPLFPLLSPEKHFAVRCWKFSNFFLPFPHSSVKTFLSASFCMTLLQSLPIISSSDTRKAIKTCHVWTYKNVSCGRKEGNVWI